MALFNNFPWTNFHELNLDWIVQQVKEIHASFPEGLIGIPKGGTGADNAEDARANLGIIAPNIPMAEGGTTTLDQEISRLEDNINTLADDVKYRIFRLVADLGLTSGTATLSSCWAAMSIGDILIAPPSEFTSEQVPENTGSVVLVRTGGTSGSLRFYGSRTYEQQFVNNYPSGIWNLIVNNTDIIPLNRGGTGASTAEQARQNLGIDFSGTVLSVAGVGADTAGNVPLKLDNLVYNTLSELGLASGSTLAAVWTALPNNSLLIANAADIADPPSNQPGTLEIYKGTSDIPGFIRFYSKVDTYNDYAMYMTAAGDPTGVWKEIINTNYTTAQCSTSFSASLNQLVKWGPFVILKLRLTKTTTTNNNVANIPEGYRPATPQFLRIGTYPQGGTTPDVIPVDIGTNGEITTRTTFAGEVTINLVYET